MSTLSIATSGLSAASLRLEVAASNIANARDTGPLPPAGGTPTNSSNGSSFPAAYVPLQVNQVDQTTGSAPAGTLATVTSVSPSFVVQSDPNAPFANQDGLVAAPNVDLASQFIQLLTAKY